MPDDDVILKRLQQRFGVDARTKFADELRQLEPMIEDGLLNLSEHGIQVYNSGRLLIRRICMVFDEYLTRSNLIGYSKVI